MPKSFNKLKIINDPLYGFITIPYEIIFDLIEHPYFQRLRRIKQLGLTHLVYPGAYHTRFHHALGCMHLMVNAIEVLKSKGVAITEDESEAACIAILLHDIGHGPFSHALESSIISNIHHEDMSVAFMNYLNIEMGGRLTKAISIFRNEYSKKFLHQLVSGQLDMDRLDYLNRDSFFTGVSEGVVSYDRILKMLNVHEDHLVIESKGIYSIEKFIIARRLMYWQVYLHKTVLSSEFMLLNILKRAREIAADQEIFATPALDFFLHNEFKKSELEREDVLKNYADLDDYDIHTAVKIWQSHPDPVLSMLSKGMVNRVLYRMEITDDVQKGRKEDLLMKAEAVYGLKGSDLNYIVFEGTVSNNAYNPVLDRINILYKNGQVRDIAEASDSLNISVLSRPVTKYYLGYPKELVRTEK